MFKTCYVPIITCIMSKKPVYCVVQCRILPTLQHDFVLGVNWLQQVNPVIDWQAYILQITVEGLQNLQYLSGLPVNPVSYADLCSLQQIAKGLHRDFVDKAWLMLLQSHIEPATREVTAYHEGGGDREIQDPTRWDKLVAEFHDIFDPPCIDRC